MTGAGKPTAAESLTDSDRNPASSGAPSLPLYLAGLVVMLCGIMAANAALVQPDLGWMESTVFLTGLGFLFSYGCRGLGVKSQTVDLGFAAVILLLLAGVVTHRIVLEQFLPNGADIPQMRLLALLVWGGTFGAWTLFSDTRVMLIAVPVMTALSLAASIDLNTPVLVCFGTFILTLLFLLIHQNYLQNRARATAKARMSLPPRLLLTQFVQAGLCGLAVLLAGKVVIVPAQAVFSRLALSQAIRQLGVFKPPTATGGSAALNFSDDDTLSIGTGEAWSDSPDVLMQVAPSDGQEHYWRGRTYDLYTGEGWQSSLEDKKAPLPSSGTDAEHRSAYDVPPSLTPGDLDAPPSTALPMTATFHVLGNTSQFYAAADPRRIILAGESMQGPLVVRACRDGRLDLEDRGVRFPYAVQSQPAPDAMQPEAQAHLRQAGTIYPAEVRTQYLGISGTGITQADDVAFFKQAVSEALHSLPPDRRDPLDEALAIRAWVSQRCVYSLAPPPIPTEVDHVHAFLNDTRRGYCDMFASSMAILCRTAGIPARLATGFAPGDPQGAGSFNLRSEDKHAWTEVYFPGTGWVTFDATMGSVSDGSVTRLRSHSPAFWRNWLPHFQLGAGWELVYPLLALILLIVGYVLKTEVYDRRRALRQASARTVGLPETRHTLLGRQYARLTLALARLGLPRRPSETPAEYAVRVTSLLPVVERESGVSLPPGFVAALTAEFTRACYGGPAAPHLQGVAEMPEIAQFEAVARRAVWVRLWRRMTHVGPLSANAVAKRGRGQASLLDRIP